MSSGICVEFMHSYAPVDDSGRIGIVFDHTDPDTGPVMRPP